MPLAVAALPVIVVALVAMIVLWGLSLLLSSVLKSMANHVPVIGPSLGRAIGAIIDQAVSLGSAGARAVIGDAVGFILAPVYWIERHVTSMINFLDSLVSAIAYITRSLIPSEVSVLEKDISTAYHQATTYAQNLANGIYGALAHDIAALENLIEATAIAVEHYAAALMAQAEAYTTAAITAETRYVTGLASGLESEIISVAQQDAAYAQTLYHDAITYVNTVVTGVEDQTIVDINNVTGWVTTQVTALQHYIAVISADALDTALEAVGVVEADLGNLKSECTDNLCKGLSDSASLANALMDAAWMTALLGYAGWAIEDPTGCGHATGDVLSPIAAGAADLVTAAASAL